MWLKGDIWVAAFGVWRISRHLTLVFYDSTGIVADDHGRKVNHDELT